APLVLRPPRSGVPGTRGGDVGRPDQDRTARLDLLDVYRTGHVCTPVVALDLAEEGVQVGDRQCVADPPWLRGVGLFDRDLERETGGGRRGRVLIRQVAELLAECQRVMEAIDEIAGPVPCARRPLRRSHAVIRRGPEALRKLRAP